MTLSEVSLPGLNGSFFAAQGARGPGILVLGGSEGGRPRYMARLLAAEGFSCLALSYFGEEPLPRHLVEVPVERIEAAMTWLVGRAETEGSRIGIVGASKGAELALLLASRQPDPVGAVVAVAPSAVVFAGISMRSDGRGRSSWSARGDALAFVPYAGLARPALCAQGLSFLPMYRAGLEDLDAVEAARIPVEDIGAPIMLVTGGRDRMWPSPQMAEMIQSRLADSGRPPAIHLHFPGAGHSIMPWAPGSRLTPFGRIANTFRLAGTSGTVALGGRWKANREALRVSWPQVVSFFREHLA